MTIKNEDILELIRICQKFGSDFQENGTVSLFADELQISKVSYRLFFNDINVESAVVFRSEHATLGEEFSFREVASNDRLVVLNIYRFKDADPLDEEFKDLISIFGESVLSGLCVRNLINAYQDSRYYDSLTRLTNLHYFMSTLDDLLLTDKKDLFSVACININNCGAINRIFGSEITDSIIKDFAQESLYLIDSDKGELLSRLASDKFLLLCEKDKIDQVLSNMNNLNISIDLHGDIVDYKVGIRAGVTDLLDMTSNTNDIIHRAEYGIRFAKLKEYPDIYHIDSDRHSNRILSTLTSDLKENRILTYFNPIFKFSGSGQKELIAARITLKWRRNGKLIDPYSLIPSENANLLREFDDYKFRRACELLNELKVSGLTGIPIGVAISSFDYFNTAFADNIIRSIDRYKIPHNMIMLEFNEESFHGYTEQMKVATRKFSKAGIPIAILNYGGEHSSLKILSGSECRYVEISPDLVNSGDKKDKIIVRHLISAVHELGYGAICRDPRDQETSELMFSIGCDFFTGMLFEKPLSERFLKIRLEDPDYYRKKPEDDKA